MESTYWISINNYLSAMPLAEGIAVLLGLLYLILAAKESLWCWLCAFLSTALYIRILYEANLQSEVLLQFFYLIMAGVGFYEWRYGQKGQKELPITRFSLKQHLLWGAAGIAGTMVLGYITGTYFNASYPYLDAFVTVFAVITTFMVTFKILENWLYWLVIDGISIYLYAQKELYFTVLLFMLYEIIVVVGYIRWRKEYLRQKSA